MMFKDLMMMDAQMLSVYHYLEERCTSVPYLQ